MVRHNVASSAMMPSHQRGRTMNSKLLGAALITAAVVAVGPAQAAKMHGAGCSGANLEKTETAIEGMADGDARYTAQREIAADRKSTRLNSSHQIISYAVFCL